MSAKPETKTAYTQYSVEDFKITESSKENIATISKRTSSSKINAQPQTGSQNKRNLSSNEPSSGEANARVRAQNQHMTNMLNGSSKRSDDAIKLQNKFGAFEEADDMELEETLRRLRDQNSRSRSPVLPP